MGGVDQEKKKNYYFTTLVEHLSHGLYIVLTELVANAFLAPPI